MPNNLHKILRKHNKPISGPANTSYYRSPRHLMNCTHISREHKGWKNTINNNNTGENNENSEDIFVAAEKPKTTELDIWHSQTICVDICWNLNKSI